MKTKLIILLLLISGGIYGQKSDTVTVYINKRKTDSDGRTHLWYSKVENGKVLQGKKDTLFYSVCACPKTKPLPLEGDTSHILRSDMVYIPGKVTWRKQN